jgi:hypothetical protein
MPKKKTPQNQNTFHYQQPTHSKASSRINQCTTEFQSPLKPLHNDLDLNPPLCQSPHHHVSSIFFILKNPTLNHSHPFTATEFQFPRRRKTVKLPNQPPTHSLNSHSIQFNSIQFNPTTTDSLNTMYPLHKKFSVKFSPGAHSQSCINKCGFNCSPRS